MQNHSRTSRAAPVREDQRLDIEEISSTLMRWIDGANDGSDDGSESGAFDEDALLADMTPARLRNYPGAGFLHMTSADWHRLPDSCKGSWLETAHGSRHAPHQVRIALTPDAALLPVYLVDAACVDPRRLSLA